MDMCLPLVFLCFLSSAFARPDGAPLSACKTLMPVHSGIEARRDSAPYRVTAVPSGNKIRVTISSPIGEEFEGFILQARSSRNRNQIVHGTFSTSEVSKTMDCSGGKQNSLTQVSPTAKKQVITEFTPSGGVNEDIVFRATVAKTFALFWTEIDSAPLSISSGPETGKKNVAIGEALNRITIVPTTTYRMAMVVGEKGYEFLRSAPGATLSWVATNEARHPMYAGCFVSKGCFGYPSDCATNGDCEVLLTYTPSSNGIRFSMHGYLDSRTYMAMAFSTDALMGSDSVTECYRDDSDIIARESWNEGKSNTRTQNLARERYSGEYINGVSTCSWTTPLVTESHGRTYNLADETYYALLAKGPVQQNGRLGYHADNRRIASAEGIDFTAVDKTGSQGATDSVKIHGSTEEITTVPYSPSVFVSDDSVESASDTGDSFTTKTTPTDTTTEKMENHSSHLSIDILILLVVLGFASWASGEIFFGNLAH